MKKKIKSLSSSSSLETQLDTLFKDPEVRKKITTMLAIEALNSDSYLMKTIETKLNEPSTKVTPKVTPKAEPKKVSRLFPHVNLDSYEEEVGKEMILKATETMVEDESSLQTWAVVIDGHRLSPRQVYKAAFECAGYDVDWHYNTYRSLNYLDRHGFKIIKVK